MSRHDPTSLAGYDTRALSIFDTAFNAVKEPDWIERWSPSSLHLFSGRDVGNRLITNQSALGEVGDRMSAAVDRFTVKCLLPDEHMAAVEVGMTLLLVVGDQPYIEMPLMPEPVSHQGRAQVRTFVCLPMQRVHIPARQSFSVFLHFNDEARKAVDQSVGERMMRVWMQGLRYWTIDNKGRALELEKSDV